MIEFTGRTCVHESKSQHPSINRETPMTETTNSPRAGREYARLHGMTNGGTWGTSKIALDAAGSDWVWVADESGGIEDATAIRLFRWSDDTGLMGILDFGGYWDLAEDSPLGVWSCDEIDKHAATIEHPVFELNRGSYWGTSDDRADRWYIERKDSTTVDRRGSGYASINEALDATVQGWEGKAPLSRLAKLGEEAARTPIQTTA